MPARLNRCKAELKMGSHRNRVLQDEWKQFGSENFEIKELEILEPADDPGYDDEILTFFNRAALRASSTICLTQKEKETMKSFAEKAYDLLRKVPKGRVTTYKEIAHAMDTRAYQGVGQVMRNNPYAPEVP